MVQVTQYLRRRQQGGFSIERLYEDVRGHLPSDITLQVRENRFRSKGILGRVLDTIAARFWQGEVNHITGDVHYLAYFLTSAKTILTIHDCVLLEERSGFRWLVIWLLWYYLPIMRCARIVVVSGFTGRQLTKLVRCPQDKIVVIHNCVSDEFRPCRRKLRAGRPKLLQIGTGFNKNIERVAAALSGLDVEYVVIGQMNPRQVEACEAAGLSYNSHHGLSRRGVLEAYNECELLIFASTYEGFGLPILEAQAVGRPVVTSDRASMPEVGGDAACYVDPFDVRSIRDGILRVLNDEAYCELLVERGFRNVARFKANVIANEYAALYRAVAGGE